MGRWYGGRDNGCGAAQVNVVETSLVMTSTMKKVGGWNYMTYACPDFERHVEKKLEQREEFLVMSPYPHFWLARFPELKAISMQTLGSAEKPNQGKLMIRKESIGKLSPKARSVVQAIFIGSKDMQKMDGWSMGIDNY